MKNLIPRFLNIWKKEDIMFNQAEEIASVSSGLSLNDKDRDLNADLIEIHNFFKPIDNLFGDYETRKIHSLEKYLFLKLYEKSPKFKERNYQEKIKESENANFENSTDWKRIIITTKEVNELQKPGCLLIVFLIFDNQKKDQFIDFRICERKTLWDEFQKFGFVVSNNNDTVFQKFIIDPVKIIHAHMLSDSRYNAFLRPIINSYTEKINSSINNIDDDNIDKENCEQEEDKKLKKYQNLETEFTKSIILIKNRFENLKSQYGWNRITDANLYELYQDNNDIIEGGKLKKISQLEEKIEYFLAHLFCSRKIKLKNFEKFNDIRARYGYENGKYVLFLHPYDSESNNPIRYPPPSE